MQTRLGRKHDLGKVPSQKAIKAEAGILYKLLANPLCLLTGIAV
jgi:hypothetical protein